jgi:hypothetical protein
MDASKNLVLPTTINQKPGLETGEIFFIGTVTTNATPILT